MCWSLLWAAFFFVFELTFAWHNQPEFYESLRGAPEGFTLPFIFYERIIGFFLKLFILHVVWASFIACLSIGLARQSQWVRGRLLKVVLWISLASWVWMLCLNQVCYPNSQFAALTQVFFSKSMAWCLSCVLGVVFVLLCVTAYPKTMGVLLISWTVIHALPKKQAAKPSSQASPNIVLIGMDALRPDALKNMPVLSKFLSDHHFYQNAYTPIGRTFPAWVSVLTGQSPELHGVRYDLMQVPKTVLKNNLAKTFQQKGYDTWFATDDVFFSHLPMKMGFEHTLTPPEDAASLVLSPMGDLPLLNLWLKTPWGRAWFPDQAFNREASVQYDPMRFVQYLNQALQKHPREKPLFFSMHLCLTHYPYTWVSSKKANTPKAQYQQAAAVLDKQFAQWMHVLRAQGVLSHAMVFVFSDHGESFGKPHFKGGLGDGVGHGTDALALSQYQIVFGAAQFGSFERELKPHRLVSLLDIAPSLGLQKKPYEGIDLFARDVPRAVAWETGWAPPLLSGNHRALIQAYASQYRLNPKTGAAHLKTEAAQKRLKSKSFGTYCPPFLLIRTPSQLFWGEI